MTKKIVFIFAMFLFLGSGCNTFNQTEDLNKDTSDKVKNITIEHPQKNQEITLPFTVKGKGRVFESMLSIAIRDKNGKKLYETYTMTDAPEIGKFGPYEEEIKFLLDMPQDENLFVEAFNYSAKDGSIENLVSIPVKLKNLKTQTVKLHFNKTASNSVCEKTEYLTRIIPVTPAIGSATLNLLLQGPTEQEKGLGFITSIPAKTILNSLKIENSTAYVDFNDRLDFQIAGSCNVQAIRAQIENTLKQFSTIDNVVISIDGESEEILQP